MSSIEVNVIVPERVILPRSDSSQDISISNSSPEVMSPAVICSISSGPSLPNAPYSLTAPKSAVCCSGVGLLPHDAKNSKEKETTAKKLFS